MCIQQLFVFNRIALSVLDIALMFDVENKSSSKKDEFAVSANLAYGEVKLETKGDVGGEYEDPDKIVRSAGKTGELASYPL